MDVEKEKLNRVIDWVQAQKLGPSFEEEKM